MWALAARHTGHVGYAMGTKGIGLEANPPVVDCSGWAAVLLTAGMAAANATAQAAVFDTDGMAAVHTWSDRMIAVLEARTGFILQGAAITADALPPLATIGLQQGGGAWAANHERPRGITHVVQLLLRPGDGEPFVSESQGMWKPYGLRLLPLAEWLRATQPLLARGGAWAVDGFAPRQG